MIDWNKRNGGFLDDFNVMNYQVSNLSQQIDKLQQENERLKEDYINLKNYIVLRKVDTEVQDKATLYNIELENINKKRYEDYKSRVEKAVEYLKNNCFIDKCCIKYEAIDITNVMDILNGKE